MNKKALLLCAGHNDLGLLRALKKLGYYVVVTGTKIDPTGKKLADKWLPIDYSDKEAVLLAAIDERIDCICQCCNDYGVYTAAYVAEKLNLPGYDSLEAIKILHNKDRFKEFALKNGILTTRAYSFEDAAYAIEKIAKMQLPVIIKPVDASAGNGISKVENINDIEAAVKYAFQKSKEGRIIAERFLEGKQYGFCTFLLNGKVAAVSSNNEYSIINPYRVEIDTYPADNYQVCKDYLTDEIEKMAKLLKLKDGIFHLQYIYYDNKPWIIEVMRRVLGNMYSVPANRLNKIDWDYWETRAKCGLDCSDFPKGISQEEYYAYKAVMASDNGIIESVEVPDIYKKYIYDEYWLMEEGNKITNYLSEPVGFLFMEFADKEEMEEILINKYRCDLVKIRRCD